MTENRATYSAAPDLTPIEELRELLTEADILQIIKGVRAIQEHGGWGEMRLPFQKGHITQGSVTHSTVENSCK